MNNQAHFWTQANEWAFFNSWTMKKYQIEKNISENLIEIFCNSSICSDKNALF